jgi:low molecular weight phosphotyrosine protein phosphatase
MLRPAVPPPLVRRSALLSPKHDLPHISTQFGVPTSHKARRVCEGDFYSFTHILAADDSNLGALLRKKPDDATAEVKLWGSYLDNEPIPDPFCGEIVS